MRGAAVCACVWARVCVCAVASTAQTAELLLESGADISLQDFSGDTALHWAARRGWGTLLLAVLRKSESVAPGSTRGVIETLVRWRARVGVHVLA